mmetsp:Transcript_1594/g.2018  ORF Transcript_1594/g.2018 Transcript_1594/m.2018 type:complete len:121 (-) Transcript_1594:32-394(-)
MCGARYIGGTSPVHPKGKGKFLFTNDAEFEGQFKTGHIISSTVDEGVLTLHGETYKAKLEEIYFTRYQFVQLRLIEAPYTKFEANLFTNGELKCVQEFSPPKYEDDDLPPSEDSDEPCED